MDPASLPEREARQLLDLARRDRRAAEEAIAKLPPDAQLALVCEAPLSQRGALLDLLADPEKLVPALPEAEFCFTVKAIGLADAAWLLDHATPEQVVAAIDLDAWSGTALDRTAARDWLEALARTSSESQLRALEALDLEVLVLALSARMGVAQKPTDDEGWTPPPGAQTLEGQFHYWARDEGDDLADVTTLLRTLFEGAYWTYFRLMQGLLWELVADTEEWALRWRTGRLEDLGFPPWDEAARIYRFLRPAELAALPAGERPFLVAAWRLPVWIPRLPEAVGPRARVFDAIAGLDEEERRAAFYAFVALANKVAVADRLPLGDASSTPSAIAKTARFASDGLAHLAAENALEDVEVLRRVSLERLFCVGANLDPASARP
jgi:hypothetical protein